MSSRESTHSSSSNCETVRLPRGSACLNCKRRRVRCDAQRPICGPCSRFRGHELDDCEFYEGHPPTIQVLEKKEEDLIIKLEYLRRQGGSCEMPRGGTSCGSPLVGEEFKTLPAGKIQGLLTHFCAFASEIGFFLDPERFIHSALQNCNLGHHSRPCPSLLYAVCLWGSRAFPYHVQKSFEETVLPYALHFANEDLSGTHPRRCLHVMQAEVLLSMFFLNNGQMVEGSYHANAAASLAISTKSNIIRSPSRAQRSPGDLVDEGEWIDGFWIIVALSNYWVLVNENQTFTFYDAPQMAIDTPWPLSNYRQEKLASAGHKTLERFLAGSQDDGYSLLALHAKVSVLLKRAIENGQKPGPGAAHQFSITNNALEQLMLTLPRLDQQMSPQQRQRLATIHMLTQVALIKLHRPNARSSNTARQRCIQAARTIADIAAQYPTANPLQLVDPITGLVCYIAHDIVTTEIRHAHEQGYVEDKRLASASNQILYYMDSTGANSPLIVKLVHSMKGAR
ncbi:hypothetical protein AGABI1DRAFT_129295 [Agaricus bisporus var. burnettii JB137-S8]|uniref:Zn(2)-C6 fungal-type domain-containing protein n=1 Tax=Agaricus bisporus var. burnettii (strain JB137-S8 / ATCC MYA-4627 / FGSC 10392) TaxID=597362 RepID=K5VX34_AGABU|nr:uncharacterized protein AGABI1DRAFT_129295 [Agaricus bisporus var. burnettii JB137-S8]EKM79034.1 hypothetical protein AGABI1DRAFT_129295 [Agaricus bisporus var. burnettii JB137-S8]